MEKAEAEDSIEMAAEDNRTVPASGGGSGSGSGLASSRGGTSSAASGGASSGTAGVSAPAGGGSQSGGNAPAGGRPSAGSAGAGNGGGADANELSKTKNWSTPGNQSLMLNESGVRLSKGSQTRINVMENGIRGIGKGDMILSAEDICWESHEYLHGGKGVYIAEKPGQQHPAAAGCRPHEGGGCLHKEPGERPASYPDRGRCCSSAGHV